MAGHKFFDKIAVIAMVAALLITALFMRGEAFGIEKIVPEEETTELTDNDLDDSWDTGSATLISLTGDGAEITGDGAYVLDGDVVIYAAGRYILEGTLTDGSIIVDEASKTKGKVWILANAASVCCSDSAALDIEEADKVFLTLAEGTENSFVSGAAYSEEAVENNIRGAVFSRDDLTINGTGSLTVTAGYRHGIVCNDDLRIAGGTITVTAAEDGIHANDSAIFRGMDLTIDAGDDGITVSNDEDTGYVTIESGVINIVKCGEGIESKTVTIEDGDVTVSFTDDGINAGGTGSLLTVNGGTLTLLSADGRDVDGLDSNGDIVINGGTVLVSVNGESMNNAIDYGSESGGQCFINGGTIIAAGSTGMAEAMSGDSAQPSIMYNFDTALEAGQQVSLLTADGSVLLEGTVPYSFSSLVLSTPELAVGEQYTLLVGGTEYEVSLTETATTVGNAGMGGFGGGFGGRGGFGGGRGGYGGFGGQSGQDGQDGENAGGQGGFGGSGNWQQGTESGEAARAEGGMPQPPERAEGEMPQPPEWAEGEMPQPPEWAEGEMPQPPEGMEDPAGEASEGASAGMPESSEWAEGGTQEGYRRGHGGMGGGQRGMGGPMEENAAEETGMSPEDIRTALIITGVSALVLAAGIFAAAKMKNKKNIG